MNIQLLRALGGLGGGGGIKVPLYVDSRDWYRASNYPAGVANTEKTATKLTDTTFTASDATGLAYSIPITILTTTGKYLFRYVTDVTGTIVTIDEAITEDLSKFYFTINTAADFLHLSDAGFKAMGQALASETKLYRQRNSLVFNGNMRLAKDETVTSQLKTYKISDNTLLHDFVFLPGSSQTGSNFAYKAFGVVNQVEPTQSGAYLIQSNIVGYGVKLTLPEIKAGGFVEVSAGTTLYSTARGEGTVELCDANDNVVSSTLTPKGPVLKIIRFDIATTGIYTLKFKVSSVPDSNYTRFVIGNIYAYNDKGLNTSLFPTNSKIVIFGDSWSVRSTADNPKKINFDGSTSEGICYLGHYLELAGHTVTYAGMGSTTSEWGRYWLDHVLTSIQKPTHVVLHFGLNDFNTRTNYPSTSSTFDFSPSNMWAFQQSNAGGVFASTDEARYLANMRYMINEIIKRGITPVVLINPTHAQYQFASGFQGLESQLLDGIYE